MASLVDPSDHSPIEDAEALQKAVKGDHTIHLFSFLLSELFFDSIMKTLYPSFTHYNHCFY